MVDSGAARLMVSRPPKATYASRMQMGYCALLAQMMGQLSWVAAVGVDADCWSRGTGSLGGLCRSALPKTGRLVLMLTRQTEPASRCLSWP